MKTRARAALRRKRRKAERAWLASRRRGWEPKPEWNGLSAVRCVNADPWLYPRVDFSLLLNLDARDWSPPAGSRGPSMLRRAYTAWRAKTESRAAIDRMTWQSYNPFKRPA